MNDNPQTESPKPLVLQCACKNGQMVIRKSTSASPTSAKLFMPLYLNEDPRLYVHKGQLVRPFVVIEFEYLRTIDVSGIDIALYQEVATNEFDPTDMAPITVRSLEQDFAELNAQ